VSDFDVIVVGAGPAGSTAAERLAQDGWRVALLEKSPLPGTSTVCGGMLSQARITEFRVPADIVEKVMAKSHYVGPWGVVENPTTQVTVLRRRFDRYLAERAAGEGAELLVNTRASAVRPLAPGHVEVAVRLRGRQGGDGGERTLTARGLILADGVFTLARQMGIGFEVRPDRTAFALAYELAWPGNPRRHFEVYFDVGGAWSFAWIFPKRDVLNVGAGCMVADLKDRNLRKDLEYFINAHPGAAETLRDKEVVRRRGGFIPMHPAAHIYGPSTLVVGDAAGMVNALFGSGLDNALQSGALAGQVMSEALAQDDLSPQFLSRYQRLWEATINHRLIQTQALLSRWGHRLSRLDRHLLAKVIQGICFGGRLSRWQKLKVLAYPLLGNPGLSSTAGR